MMDAYGIYWRSGISLLFFPVSSIALDNDEDAFPSHLSPSEQSCTRSAELNTYMPTTVHTCNLPALFPRLALQLDCATQFPAEEPGGPSISGAPTALSGFC